MLSKPESHDHAFKGVNIVARTIGTMWLWLTGWRAVGALPNVKKAVVIAAPHTSGWDFVHMIAVAWHLNLDVKWFGKHTLFESAFGWFFRGAGGIPVDRRHPHGMVGSIADRFASSDKLLLAVPAEGTRDFRPYWKSGFYHIARTADVPVVFGFIDFQRKEAGFGPSLQLSGDMRADMDVVRGFYSTLTAYRPEDYSTIRLRGEEEEGSSTDG